MQPAIQIVPYEEFGRLHLRSFCPNDNLYSEYVVENSQGHFITEHIHGVNFTRWSKRPDDLAVIVIEPDRWESSGWASNVAPSILSAIGLRLEAGLSLEETTSRFGTPPRWRSKDGRNVMFHIGGNSPYEVQCHYNPADNMKLNRVVIRRLDIELPEGE